MQRSAKQANSVTCCLFMFNRMSLRTRSNAVQHCVTADKQTATRRKGHVPLYEKSFQRLFFSVSLDRNCRLLKNRKFSFSSSSSGFFIMGLTSAPFHTSGKQPCSREALIINNIAADNFSTYSLKILVGIGSISHDFAGELIINFFTKSNEIGSDLV